MSWNNRVVWSEGMFIGTQHFQQHDRYLENLIDARSRPLSAGAWGFSELLIDQGLLAQGKLAIVSARGLLPDGTPFNIPQDDLAPSPLNIDEHLRDGLVPVPATPSTKAKPSKRRATSARCGKCATTTHPSKTVRRWRWAPAPCAC